MKSNRRINLRRIGLALVALLAILCSRRAEPASATDQAVTEYWVSVLQEFRVPEPGPISSRTAELKSLILNAPLETLPPAVRTGVTLCQIKIHCRLGNKSGIEAIEQRVLQNPDWKPADEDRSIVSELAALRFGRSFCSMPGGPQEGENLEEYDAIAERFWLSRNVDRHAALEIKELAMKHYSHSSWEAAWSALTLARDYSIVGDLQSAERWYSMIPNGNLETLTVAGFYTSGGAYIPPRPTDQLKTFQISMKDVGMQIDRLRMRSVSRVNAEDTITTAMPNSTRPDPSDSPARGTW